MKKDLQYALVTSSALPGEIQESEHYIDLEKEQWLDLVDYSAEVVGTDDQQEILFLIVAKGTTEQQAEDDARRAAKEREKIDLGEAHDCLKVKHDTLQQQLDALLNNKETLEKELSRLHLEDEKDMKEAEERKEHKSELRGKSISLFNALYNK